MIMIKNVIVIEFFKEARRKTEFYEIHTRNAHKKTTPKNVKFDYCPYAKMLSLESQGKQKKVDEMVTM